MARGEIKQTLNKKKPLSQVNKDIKYVSTTVNHLHGKNNEGYNRTTIHLPNEVHKQVKVYCAKTDISFKDFVTNAIVEKMHKDISP